MRGKFITLEGIDGAGKSTHLEWLAGRLRRNGMRMQVTREPGGTELGEKLRTILLDPASSMNAESETLLMFAARREHLQSVIEPALARGTGVLCDRFSDATFAYQGGGRGVAWKRLLELERWVQGDLQPDMTILFDVSPALGRSRASLARRTDRFEREHDEFYERVRTAYLRRAQEAPLRVRVIDASRSVDEVRTALGELVGTICQR